MRISDWSSDVCSSDLLANSKYREIYPGLRDLVEHGRRFREIAEAIVARDIADLGELSREAWLARRIGQHSDPQPRFEQHYADGRWVRISERRTPDRSEENTSELQSLMRNSYAVF